VPQERLVVRIGEKNEASVRLFEKLGFRITRYVEVFGEVEMRYGGGTPLVASSVQEQQLEGRESEGTDGLLLRQWRMGDMQKLE
jgi:hypothetical protein